MNKAAVAQTILREFFVGLEKYYLLEQLVDQVIDFSPDLFFFFLLLTALGLVILLHVVKVQEVTVELPVDC